MTNVAKTTQQRTMTVTKHNREATIFSLTLGIWKLTSFSFSYSSIKVSNTSGFM